MRSAKGFSLVEMTVVIGLIVLLAGLTLSGSAAVLRHSEQRQTRTVLAQLDGAITEWELQADRKLSWWQLPPDSLEDYDAREVHSNTPEVLIITEILDVVMRSATIRQIIAGIDPELIYHYGDDTAPWLDEQQEIPQVNDRFVGSITVLDAWGTPIYATHPGRLWTEQDAEGIYTLDRNQDGTIYTGNEEDYGIAPNRRIVFVSAGPDGLFGLTQEFLHLSQLARPDARDEARRDNIYSIPPVIGSHSYP